VNQANGTGPRTPDQLTASQRALDLNLPNDALRQLDEIWPGPGEAPQAYAW
jgi:aryl-alcohol dehydrogenase-like predicted oxidoreductase